jgi:hypothetical protein
VRLSGISLSFISYETEGTFLPTSFTLMTISDPHLLIASLHRQALVRLCDAGSRHWQGLSIAGRHLGVSSNWKRRLRELDSTLGMVEKVTEESCSIWLEKLDAELQRVMPPPPPPPPLPMGCSVCGSFLCLEEHEVSIACAGHVPAACNHLEQFCDDISSRSDELSELVFGSIQYLESDTSFTVQHLPQEFVLESFPDNSALLIGFGLHSSDDDGKLVEVSIDISSRSDEPSELVFDSIQYLESDTSFTVQHLPQVVVLESFPDSSSLLIGFGSSVLLSSDDDGKLVEVSTTGGDTHSPYFSGGTGSPKLPESDCGDLTKLQVCNVVAPALGDRHTTPARTDGPKAQPPSTGKQCGPQGKGKGGHAIPAQPPFTGKLCGQSGIQVCNVVAPAMGDRHTTPVRPGGAFADVAWPSMPCL